MIEEILSPAVDRYMVSELKTNQVFNYHYYFMKNEKYLKCYINEDGVVRLLKLGVDYAVKSTSGQGNVFGEVRYIGNHIQSSLVFVIERSVPIDQRELFSGYGDIGLTTGAAIDKAVINIQDNLLNNDPRKISIHIGEAEVADAETANLELPQRRENTILGFDKENNVICEKKYSAGDGIEISQNNVISAKALPSRTDYIAGDNIQITNSSMSGELVLESADGKFVRTDLLPSLESGKFFVCLKNEKEQNSKIAVFNDNVGGVQFDIVETISDIENNFHILPQSFLAAVTDGNPAYYAFHARKVGDVPFLDVSCSLDLKRWKQFLLPTHAASDYFLDIIHTSFGYFKNLPLTVLTYDESIFFVRSFEEGKHGHFYLDPSFDTILAGGVAIRNDDFVIIANKKDTEEQKIRVYSAIESPYKDFIAYDFPIKMKNVMAFNNEYIFYTDHALFKVNDFTKSDFTIPLFESDTTINDVSYQDGKVFVCCDEGKIYKSDDLSNWTLYDVALVGTGNIVSCCYSYDILYTPFLLTTDSQGFVRKVSGSVHVISATDTTYENATAESDGLMSKEDKAKLDTVHAGAEENVQSDWNEIDNNSDAYIKNKPNLSKVALSNNYNDLDNKPALKPVATSGDYNDLDNKITVGEGLKQTKDNMISALKAGVSTLGGIKVGKNLRVSDDGTLHGQAGASDIFAGDNIIIEKSRGIQSVMGGDFSSVAYGFGMYMAVGSSVIAISSNGKDWEYHFPQELFPALPYAIYIKCVTTDKENFVAVGYNPLTNADPAYAMVISPDLKVRSLYALPLSLRNVQSICFAEGGGGAGSLYVFGGVGFVTTTTNFQSFIGGADIPKWQHLTSCILLPDRVVVFSCKGGAILIVKLSENGIYSLEFKTVAETSEDIKTISNTPKGIYIGTDNTKIYCSIDNAETWEFVTKLPTPSMSPSFIRGIACNSTDFYAIAKGGLFTSYDGLHWERYNLGGDYSFQVLFSSDDVVLTVGYKNPKWQETSLYSLPLEDIKISAVDTTYNAATSFDDGLMSSDDKRKLDDLSTVAITGSYNDLNNKLVGGENIHIDENNVVSYVGGVGEDLYKAGDHIRIDKAHNVKQCYTDANSTVDMLLHNDEHVTAPLYPNKLMLSEASRKCEEWKEVVLPFEYSGYGVVRSNDKMYVVDKDNHVRVSRIDDLVTWIDDGQIPKAPAEYRHYKGAYGVCGGKEHVVFYAVINSDPAETAIAYYIDGMQRTLKVLPYRIVGMTFDENRIYCTTDAVDILVYNAEFTYLLQILSIPETSLIDAQYLNNRLLVLAWSNNSNKCLYASASPYSSFEKVTDDFDKDALNKIFIYKNTFSFVYDNRLYTSDDAFNWSYATLDKAYEFGMYLNKFSLVYEKSNYALYKHMGGMNTISATYENATADSDGLMSKEDKIKLNAAMRFPDGETGFTLPSAAGRADKVITFDSSGNIDLHSTHDYDKWRNVRISTVESTTEVNLELPRALERANKVIGFSSDGKSVEMKSSGEEQVNGDWNATSGKAQILNKPALTTVAISGSYNDLNDKPILSTVAASGSYNDLTDKLVAGTNITISNNVISSTGGGQPFVLNPATYTVLGGIKVGDNLNIFADGTLRAYLPGEIYTDKIASVTMPSLGDWNAVCYGMNKFVAVKGNSNVAAYSSDGITWTQTTLPSGGGWVSVCYGMNKFVAVRGNSNQAALSYNGITWSQIILPSAAAWSSVCYGGGMFMVIAGNNGKEAAYSTDGNNWKPSTLPYKDFWFSLCYGQDKFMILNGRIENEAAHSYENEGIIEWDVVTIPPFGEWKSICYGADKFVAISSGLNKGIYSYDGFRWQEIYLPGFADWRSVCYGGGKFVVVSSNTKAAYSYDGIIWNQITLPSIGYWSSICYGANKFITLNSNSGIMIPCVPIIRG